MATAGKYDVLESIIKLYDENARLKIENARLNSNSADMRSALSDGYESVDPYATEKAEILKLGMDTVLENALNYWQDVRVNRGDSGNIIAESYEKWLDRVVRRIPDFMSRDKFYEMFAVSLHEKYSLEKKKAIGELVESEREEDGE